MANVFRDLSIDCVKTCADIYNIRQQADICKTRLLCQTMMSLLIKQFDKNVVNKFPKGLNII